MKFRDKNEPVFSEPKLGIILADRIFHKYAIKSIGEA